MDSMLSNVQKGSEASLPVQIIIKYHTNINLKLLSLMYQLT